HRGSGPGISEKSERISRTQGLRARIPQMKNCRLMLTRLLMPLFSPGHIKNPPFGGFSQVLFDKANKLRFNPPFSADSAE
ncbi:MAG: hypothetical protein WD601_13970, partial [Pseudohongiellaceae bacterium]